ncbi:ATP-binding protein [Streptomyces sp. NPDC051569]|uniref:ATP-binding protein n=1 Tax=Streptomyces sp. NPDC051569 TaxID=3365661 RepID=UPI0037B36607
MRAVPDEWPDRRTGGVETSATAASVTDRRLSFTVATIDACVPVARREIAAQLAIWGLPPGSDVADTALLAVSELVTNCVQHAALSSPRAEVAVCMDSEYLTVSVHDRHPRLPEPADVPHLDGSGGWGLRLIEALAAEAGGRTSVPRDADGLGKTVTVLLPLPGNRSPSGCRGADDSTTAPA